MHIVVIVYYYRECFHVSSKAKEQFGVDPDLVHSRVLQSRWLTILQHKAHGLHVRRHRSTCTHNQAEKCESAVNFSSHLRYTFNFNPLNAGNESRYSALTHNTKFSVRITVPSRDRTPAGGLLNYLRWKHYSPQFQPKSHNSVPIFMMGNV